MIILGVIIPILIVSMVLVLPLFFQPPKSPLNHIFSAYINSTPQIDGQIDPIWLTNASYVEPILWLSGAISREDTNEGTKMYVMNNDAYLFLGIFLLNKVYTTSYLNNLLIYCDTNFDGSMDYDDLKEYDFQLSMYRDCWIDIKGAIVYIYQDSIQNGGIAYNHTNPIEGMRGDYFFEIAIPLNTTLSDPSELNVTRGDSIILAIDGSLYLGGGSSYKIDWPFDCNTLKVSTFGNITLG